MALTACRECGEDISDEATKCPKCGVRLRKAKRTIMGKIFKWLFILFNVAMIYSFVASIGGIRDMPETKSSAEQAGRAIGATLSFGVLLTIWVFGDVILGLFVLFTRPKD